LHSGEKGGYLYIHTQLVLLSFAETHLSYLKPFSNVIQIQNSAHLRRF